MAFGSEEITDIGGIQEGLDEFGHGRLVSELGCVAFDGAESGIIDDAMGQRCFADARRAVKKYDTGCPGARFVDPLHECGVVHCMERGADFI